VKGSRTQKSVTNTVVSFASQLIVILLGFLSRRVLIYSVGVEYLGINGLMSNILTIFSLAESGIGLAIGYALYKPLAENDIEQVKSLMRFFKYTYRALARNGCDRDSILPAASILPERQYRAGCQSRVLAVPAWFGVLLFVGL
jgi:NADH:ubiquinone oxidoreductase subunit K